MHQRCRGTHKGNADSPLVILLRLAKSLAGDNIAILSLVVRSQQAAQAQLKYWQRVSKKDLLNARRHVSLAPHSFHVALKLLPPTLLISRLPLPGGALRLRH